MQISYKNINFNRVRTIADETCKTKNVMN